MGEYERKDCDQFLWQNKDREMVKVLTGLRGAGKTTCLARYVRRLEEAGVPEERILYMDLSDPDMQRFFPQEALYRRILAHLSGGRRAYLFLDEVQALPDFPRLADGLFRIRHFDVYLAGSGLRAALPALRAALPGRCLVKEVYPLSFAETASALPRPPEEADLLRYTEASTLPGAYGRPDGRSALDGAVSAALFHEVLGSSAIRPGLLTRLLRLLSPRLGDRVTAKDLAAAAGRAGRPLLEKTLRTYFGQLEEAGLLLPAPLVSIGEDGEAAEMTGEGRFFFPDGAMTELWGKGEDLPYRLLRNALAVELCRRYGTIETAETLRGPVDFLTGRETIPALWQLIPRGNGTEAKEKWEILQSAPEIYRKCVLTFTPEAFPEGEGVIVKPLLSWFLRP